MKAGAPPEADLDEPDWDAVRKYLEALPDLPDDGDLPEAFPLFRLDGPPGSKDYSPKST